MFSEDSHTYGSHPRALITWLIFFPLELRSMLSAFESRDVGLWLHWPMACSSAGRCPRQGHKAICLPPGPLPHTHAHTLSLILSECSFSELSHHVVRKPGHTKRPHVGILAESPS